MTEGRRPSSDDEEGVQGPSGGSTPDARRQVGQYELIRQIGRGGMAAVYLAHQPSLDRDVALKELSSFHAGEPAMAQRFLRESRLAGSLNHPNIVTVLEYFEQDGIPYIAMEYVPRGSLRPYVGHLSLPQFAGVMEGVLAGLAHAHGFGIVHRDLKPENLMVTGDGRVKIADFGIAKATQSAATGSFMTATGTTVGTPTYMAPEQAMGRDIGIWTDLYSVGVMAWEHVLGRVPFAETETPVAILMRHVTEDIPSAAAVDATVDPQLSQWIDRLLVKEPSQRTQDPVQAWDELEEIVIAECGPRWRREARLPSERPPIDTPRPLTPAPFESQRVRTPDPVARIEAPPSEVPPTEVPPSEAPPSEPDYVTFGSPSAPADVAPGGIPAPANSPAASEPAEAGRTIEDPASGLAPAASVSAVLPIVQVPDSAVPEPEPPVRRTDTPPTTPPEPVGDDESRFITFAPAGVPVPAPQPEAPPPGAPGREPPPGSELEAVAEAEPIIVSGAEAPPAPAADADAPPEPLAEPRPEPAPGPGPGLEPERTPEPKPEPEPRRAQTPELVAAPAGATATPARRVGSSATGMFAIVAGVAALIAAAAGFLIAPSSAKKAGGGPALVTRSSPAFALSAPRPWQPATNTAAAVLKLGDEIVLSEGPGAGSMVVGTATTRGPLLLPQSLLAALQNPRPQVVTLSGHRFYRYLDLSPGSGAPTMSVYALPTDTTTVVGACLVQGATGSFPGQCEQAIGSLRLTSGSVIGLGPSSELASVLRNVATTLNGALAGATARLRAARTAGAQADAARAAAAAYSTAASSVREAHTPPAAIPATNALAGALYRAGRAYAKLAVAARLNDQRGYTAARTTITESEGAITAAYEQLAGLGYRAR